MSSIIESQNYRDNLILAIERKNENEIINIIKSGDYINILDRESSDGRTPLITAVNFGYADIVKLLLGYGASPNKDSIQLKITPLQLAVFRGKQDIVKMLIDYGANPYHEPDGGKLRTPFMIAIDMGNKNMVKLLLDIGVNPNIPTEEGTLPLIYATKLNKPEIVDIFLKKGTKPNLQYRYAYESALILAAGEGYIKIIKMLLDAGAKPNKKMDLGISPIFQASGSGKIESVKILLKAGASPNIRDNNGTTPLMSAVEIGNSVIIKKLLEAGADINAQDLQGTTALMQAASNIQPEMVKLLLDAKANPNIRDKNGNTALSLSQYINNDDINHNRIIQMLLNAQKNIMRRSTRRTRSGR
jgi:ankyrin repeat protein